MSATNEQVRAAIAEQAAEWFVENRGKAPADETAHAFADWLQTSSMHVEEYLALAALSSELAVAVDEPDAGLGVLLAEARAAGDTVVAFERPAASSVPDQARSYARRAWPLATAAAAAIVAVAVSALWAARDGERFGLPRSYGTTHGEQLVRQLPDGSVLHLNTDSTATVRYSRDERVIELERGQALFDVAHDNQRPFRVTAGPAGIIAIGTRFDVYRRPQAVTVTVVEGVIAVYPRSATRHLADAPPRDALRLGAGSQVEVTGEVGAPRRVDAGAAVAWLTRQIAFENRPLGEVAAEFNRYGRTILEIDDPTLRAVPITGVFDAYDAESFAAFLESLRGIVVEKAPGRIRVRRSSSTHREPPSSAR